MCTFPKILVVSTLVLSLRNSVSANEVTEISPKDVAPDVSFKNLQLIDTKKIPDVSYILQNEDAKYQNLKQFLEAGWPVLQANGYEQTKDTPFTIIVPKADVHGIDDTRLKDVVLEHLIPGKAFDTFNEDEVYGNANNKPIVFKTVEKLNESQWTLNGLKILRTIQINDKISAIFVDGFLGDRKAAFAKRNIQETNRYNEPQRLEMKNFTKHELPQTKDPKANPLMTFLAGMKSGTKVFQHFLSKSNITQQLDGAVYTILIPSDNAFQRWHPIDWGFYPFSVQEFTESVLRNHFLQTHYPLKMSTIKEADELKFHTLGGETVTFKGSPQPTVNNVPILADYILPNGNQIFIISEVLFVSEAVVSKLHQMHKDKETPPLLAFPWFGAQFLSHSFLALERDQRFTQITRYLNNAEVAPYISGANYTFFVPVDEAFERLGLDLVTDEVLASERGVKMLLQHFVKGRLYDRDLKDNEVFETIGGGAIKVQRPLGTDNVTINRARIIESEIFVYNLGTMFYIDDVLYSNMLKDHIKKSSGAPTTPPVISTVETSFEASEQSVVLNNDKTLTSPVFPSNLVTTPSDVEIIPSEFTEQSGTDEDFLFQDGDDEIITPKALPVHFKIQLPKK